MDFSSLMFWKKPNKEIVEAGKTSGAQITQANIKNFVVKAVGQIDQSGNNEFESPVVDLNEIKDAMATDSYIRLTVIKYSQLIFKAGYNIVSNNDDAAEYVRARFRMMSLMTDTPVDVTFQQVADDLVAYSNAFLVKSRTDMTNIGGLQAKGIYDTKPVGGYFRVDPTSIQIKRDKTGTIKNYQQQVGNDKKTFKPTEVVHFYIDKAGGAAFGTPRIASALEDVKMLRKIEGSVLKLIYRYAMPLYQMKIGIPEAGLMATTQEIKEAQSEVEKLAEDGIFITNERTQFLALGAEGEALNAVPYLKYFEQRVFAALSLSNSQVGRGGAKQDADSMEEQVHDAVKRFQHAIQVFVEEKIINELLLEGGYNPYSNEDDIVNFQFNEINLDTKVKMQTHAINEFQGNAITFEEMRQLLGMRGDSADESRLYQNMIKTPAEIAVVEAKLGGSSNTNATDETPGPTAQTKTSGSTKNIISPQNQHGTGSANIKESSGIDIIESNTAKNREHYRKNFSAVYKKYNSGRNDICSGGESADIILPLVRDSIRSSLEKYIVKNTQDGRARAINDIGKPPENMREASSSAVLLRKTDEILTNLLKDIKKRLKDASSTEAKEAAFNAVEYRLRFLCEHVAAKAYWYSYVKTCSYKGIETVYVNFGKSEDRENHESLIHTKHFSLEDIPPFHAYCTCKIGLTREAGENS